MCAACGKKARDQYGEEGGWDESCALNSYLVDEANPVIDAAQYAADRDKWDRASEANLAWLTSPDWTPDPELLELAQSVIDRRNTV